jgi:hypothetical protein
MRKLLLTIFLLTIPCLLAGGDVFINSYMFAAVRYMFHNNPTFSGQVADNTAMSLPLEAYSSDYPVGNSWEDGASTPPSTMSPGFQASGGAIYG